MALTPKQEKFSQCVADGMTQADAYYVYHLIDPRDMSVFYIGKGKADRMTHHAKEAKAGKVYNTEKHRKIVEIHESGLLVIEKKVRENLTECEALRIEKEQIKQMKETITNILSGSSVNGSVASEEAKHLLKKMGSKESWVASCYHLNKPAFEKVFGSLDNAYDVMTSALRSVMI